MYRCPRYLQISIMLFNLPWIPLNVNSVSIIYAFKAPAAIKSKKSHDGGYS